MEDSAGRGKQGNILVVCITFFAQTTANSLWLSLLSVYLDSIGLSGVWIGAVLTVQSACTSLTYMPSGRLSDMIGRRGPLIVGNAMVATSTFLMSFTKRPEFMIFILAGLGIGSGLSAPAVNALIAESVPQARAGMAFASYNIATLLASVIGSAMSGLLVTSIGYGNIFLLATAISALATGILYWFIRETERGQNSAYRSAIRESVAGSLPGTLRLLRSNRDLSMLTVALCIHSFGISALNPYIPLYASNAIHLDIVEVGLVIAIWNAGLLIAQIPSGKMTDRLGARLTLFNHVLFSTACWALYAFSRDFATAVGAMFLFGVIGAMDMPARRTIMVEFSRHEGKATVIGSIDSLTGLFGIIAPFIGGAVWAGIGHTAPFFLGAAVNAIAVPPLFVLVRRERRYRAAESRRPTPQSSVG
jgi:MFS family permease